MLKILANDGVLCRIIESAAAAPSMHNTQPWKFVVVNDDMLEVRADPDRALWVGDPHARGLYLSMGAALFNIRTAIRMTGFNPLVWPLPHPQLPPIVIAAVQAEPGRPPSFGERELYQAIWQRHTNRAPYTGEPLSASAREALADAARFEFTSFRMLGDDDAAIVLDLAAKASDQLSADVGHRMELQGWVGGDRRDDGIPAEALGAAPRRAPAPVRADLAQAVPMAGLAPADYEERPQIGVLTAAGDEPSDWLRAGQALQRILLTATARGVSSSFLYQSIELRDMRGTAAPGWPWPENPQMVIRFGYAEQAQPTPRRPVDDVLTRATAAGTA